MSKKGKDYEVALNAIRRFIFIAILLVILDGHRAWALFGDVPDAYWARDSVKDLAACAVQYVVGTTGPHGLIWGMQIHGEWVEYDLPPGMFFRLTKQVRTDSATVASFAMNCGVVITMETNTVLALWHSATGIAIKVMSGSAWFQIGRHKILATPGPGVNYEWDAGAVELKQTGFSETVQQKIAYVNGNDLWLMNDDGTGATNYIAAPPGKTIGRAAFSPDNSNVIYEVWTYSGTPQTCDLYIADGNGSNQRVWLSAGLLSEGTGLAGYSYRMRCLVGPSFSPDGASVSFARIQDYQRASYCRVKQKEICTAPVAGGPVTVLWKTMENPGGFVDSDMGENTCWLQDGDIAFMRSGRTGARWAAVVDATDTNRTAWPCDVYMEWDNEANFNPVTLNATVDGQSLAFPSGFKGYGEMTTPGDLNWLLPFPEGSGWLTPQMGAWYGPLRTHDLSAGAKSVSVQAGDGTVNLDFPSPSQLTVVKGSKSVIFPVGNYYPRTQEGGVWRIGSSGGGTPRQVTRMQSDSMAWNQDGSRVVTDFEIYGSPDYSYLQLFDSNGVFQEDAILGVGAQSGVGNCDQEGRHIVAWCGSNGVGRIKVVNTYDGSVLDLGPGTYPVFAPFHRTQVDVYEGLVQVTSTNGAITVPCGAGQSVIIDPSEHDAPVTNRLYPGPYVTNIMPSWGSAVINNTNLTVTFQFNKAIDQNTANSNRISGINWQGVAESDVNSWLLNQALYAAVRQDSANPNAFDVKTSELVSKGIGVGTWNSNSTAYAVTITNQGFSRINGNQCEITWDLHGVQGTSHLPVMQLQAVTKFRFVNPVGIAGGTLESLAGGKLTVPAGAVPGNVEFTIGYAKYLDATPNPPSTGNWVQASGVYAFAPTNQSFAINATVSLTLDGTGPNVTIWQYSGSIWTNLGGTLDPSGSMISVTVNRPGTFCAFYQVPATAQLRLSKSIEPVSAAVGEPITFNLILENMGMGSASNVVVTDVLPATLICATNSVNNNGTYNSGTRTVTWSLGTLPGQSHVELSCAATVSVSAAYGSRITNNATASSTQTGSTNSNAVIVSVRWPVMAVARFGIGGTNSVNTVNLAALAASCRRGLVEISTTQAENTNLISFTAFDKQVVTNQVIGYNTYAVFNVAAVSNRWPSAFSFAQAFGLLVERYDGDGIADVPGLTRPVHQWEIFDAFSPDTGRWAGCTLAMYAQYLRTASVVAHAADPEAVILSSGFDNVPPSGTNYLTSLLEADPGAASAIDAVSVHDGWERTSYGSGTNVVTDYLEGRLLTTMLSRLLPDREVWLTQADFTSTYSQLKGQGHTCTDTENALFLARAVPFALGSGIGHLIYTEMESKPTDTEAVKWAALVDSNGNRRVGFYVYGQLVDKLEGFQRAHLLDWGSGNMGVQFINAGDQPVWVLWNASNSAGQVSLPIGPVSQARITSTLPWSFNNTTAMWSMIQYPLTNGVLTLTVSGTPVYVEADSWVSPDINGNGIPNDLDSDTDGDEIPNDWELANGLNPFVNDANHPDPNGNGMTYFEEYQAGILPGQPAFAVRSAVATGLPIMIGWRSVSGKTYRVDWSPDLKGAWSNAVDGAIMAIGSNTVWYDTGAPKTAPFPPNSASRFYRIRLVP